MINAEELARQQGLPAGSLEMVASDLPEWPSGFTYGFRVLDNFRGDWKGKEIKRGHLPKISRGKILDAGCSRGETTFEIASLYPQCRVIGIDSDPNRIASAWTLFDLRPEEFSGMAKRIQFQVANFYKIEKHFKPSSFTGIFAMNNLSHVAREIDLLGHVIIAKGFLNVLREGGYLCMSGAGGESTATCAVFRKRGGDFEPIYVNNEFRQASSYGDWARAYGLETT